MSVHRGHAARAALAAALLAALAGCELREVSLTEPQRAVVAEAYVRLGARVQGAPGTQPSPTPALSVLLHETLGVSGRSGAVPGARITITRAAPALTIPFRESVLGDCVITTPVEAQGSCYVPAIPGVAYESLAPGDRLALRVELAAGGVLTSETVVPGRFELLNIRDASTCVVAPETGTGIVWSGSSGAWAYVSDTFIAGLARTLGRPVSDPLYLLGLSVSARDTAIVFPREFGLFARADLDHDVAVALQRGLPDSTSALVAVTAIDRNWVNWARGGNFNPSGQVRVPSVRGDGTGVFGSALIRAFRVVSQSRPGSLTPCPPDVPASVGG
jgi:hypothetical protein